MTTITINEDLPLKKTSFGTIAELFSALEEQNLFVVLHELEADEITGPLREKAEKAQKDFGEHPSNFTNV